MNRTIYLDHHATTPVDPRVLERMLPYFTEHFGNASSRTHTFGWTAEEAVDRARQQVAVAIGASPKEIVFTSGATESNNLALKGAFDAADGKNHIITVVTEHKAVLDTVDWLEARGARVTRLPVLPSGLIELSALEAALSDDTAIVSVMHANNEIGVLQPISAIGALCRQHGALFHSDVAQSIGKVPFDVDDANIDLASISGHKVYGPKGIGVLYVRRKPRARIKAQIHGGGHERGHRSGTLAVPMIVGLGEALQLAVAEREVEAERLLKLRTRLFEGLTERMTHIHLNGHATARLPGNLNVSIQYVEGEALLMGMSDIAVSSGSACTSDSLEASYVLKAIGVSEQLAHSSIRFGLGRTTTAADIDTTVERVHNAVERLRSMSPLWDMVNRGEDPERVDWNEA